MGCGSSSSATPSSEPLAVLPASQGQPSSNAHTTASPLPPASTSSPRSSPLLTLAGGGGLDDFGSVCVLVSDMSGFTKQTRQHGIVHFGCKIIRMRQIIHKVLLKHHPLVVETEADNFLVLFDTIEQGLNCACDMMSCLREYNRLLDPLLQFKFGGIGLDYGPCTLERPSGHLYGIASDGAFQLGEDVADGTILCSKRVERQMALDKWQDLRRNFHLEYSEENADELIACLDGGYFVVSPAQPSPQGDKWQDYYGDLSDASYIGQSCLLLAERYTPGLSAQQRAEVDERIKAKYMGHKDVAVIMFGLHVERITLAQSIVEAFTVKHAVLQLLHAVVDRWRGRCVEDMFIVFEHEWEAVACALQLAATMNDYNATAPASKQVAPKGFGVHSGQMLIVPNTNVHWGDCVSTASKLGEDLGEENEVLISDKVYKNVKELQMFEKVKFNMKNLETSGVQFEAYSLTGNVVESAAPSTHSLELFGTARRHSRSRKSSRTMDAATAAAAVQQPLSPVMSATAGVPTIVVAEDECGDARTSIVEAKGAPVEIATGMLSPNFAGRLIYNRNSIVQMQDEDNENMTLEQWMQVNSQKLNQLQLENSPNKAT